MEFNNHLIQIQWRSAVLKQLESIVKKDGTLLDVKQPQVAAIICSLESPSLSTSLSCCSLLHSTVDLGWLDLSSVLTALVAAAASATHVSPIIHTVGEMLVWRGSINQGEEKRGNERPYSLRMNVHPFISIFNSNPESGMYLVGEVVSMLSRDRGSDSISVLEPFLKYVFLHPLPSHHLSTVSHHLHNELVGVARHALMDSGGRKDRMDVSVKSLVQLLVRLLPLQSTKSTGEALTLVSMATQLMHIVDVMPEAGGICAELTDICLSLICELTERDIPTLTLIASLVVLVEKMEEFGSPGHTLCLSWLLMKNLTLPDVVHHLLKLCNMLRSKIKISGALLVLPLVQLLSQPLQPWDQSHDLVSTNQTTAFNILNRIQQCSPTDLKATPICSKPITRCQIQQSHADIYLRLCADSAQVDLFLKQDLKSSVSGSFDQLAIVLCAVAMRSVMVGEGVEKIVKGLASIARCDSTVAPSLLPFFIHLLSFTSCPHSKLTILHSIPNLATHELATTAVVSTIRALGESPFLISLATRLLGRVWQLQDKVFPSLLAYLTRPLAQKGRKEIDLSRAAVIRDVCLTRPELHGEEVIGLVYSYLSSGGTSDPVTVAMAVEGLVSLCKCDVVDVVTVWSVIGEGGGRLSQENRPVIAVALCSLFELAADCLDTDNKHSHKVFKATSLKHLFHFVFSGHSRTCSAALNSLAEFCSTDLFVDLLPELVASHFQVQSHDLSHDSEQEPLTGSHLIKMFHLLPIECLNDHAHFLSVLLGEELPSFGRGVISTALKHAQVPSQTERLLKTFSLSLKDSLHLPRSQPATTIAHRAALSMCGVKDQTKGQRGGGKAAVNEKLTRYLSLLDDYVKEGVACVDLEASDDWCLGLSSLEAAKEWKTFMGELVSLYAQVYLFDERVVSVVEETGSLADAEYWGFKQVLDKLEEFVRLFPDRAENLLMALVGVVSYQGCHLIGQPDHVMNSDQSVSLKLLLVELLDVLTCMISGDSIPLCSNHLLTLIDGRHLRTAALLSLPVVVEVVVQLLIEGLLADQGVHKKLALLAENLINRINNSTIWFEPQVANQILGLTLPMCKEVGMAIIQLVPLVDTAVLEIRLDLICPLSAFVPFLCLGGCGHPTSSAGRKLMSSLANRLSSLSVDSLSSTVVKLCSLHFTYGLVTLFTVGELSDEEAMALVTLLADMATKAPQEGLYQLCVGVALYGLGGMGHTRSLSVSDSIAAKWIQELEAAVRGADTSKVTPLLWGLTSLLGLCPGFKPIRIIAGGLNSYVRTLFPLVVSSFEKVIQVFPKSAVCSTSQWLLAQIQNNLSNYFSQLEKVPQDYSYLPENSILHSLHSLLEGCHSNTTPAGRRLLCAILQTVVHTKGDFPPVNWSRLLLPCLRAGICSHGDSLEKDCIASLPQLFGSQQLIIYCIHPLVLTHLQLESWCLLLEDLPLIAASAPETDLGLFLHTTLSSPHLLTAVTHSPTSQLHSSHTVNTSLVHSLLTGIHKLLTTAGTLPPSKRGVILTVVVRLYDTLTTKEGGVECFLGLIRESLDKEVTRSLLGQLAKCLSVCETSVVEKLISVPQKEEVTLFGCYGAAMECYLVLDGLKRFTTLGSIVEWTLHNTDCPRVLPSFLFLLRTMSHCCSSQLPKMSTLNQTEALHMLLTWTRNNKVSTNQMTAILVMVHFTIATDLPPLSCIDHLRLTFNQYLQDGSRTISLSELCTVLQRKCGEPKTSAVREKLCHCLLEWLGMTSDHKLKQTIIGVFSSLKSCEEYRSPLIWTSVVHLL